MSEETQTETTEQSQVTEDNITLEDVYKSAGADAQPAVEERSAPLQHTQHAPAETRAAPSSVPDPYDAENFKAYMAAQAQGTTALHQALNGVVSHLSRLQAKEAKDALVADIGKAVDSVNEIVGHPKPKVVEAMLDAKAREDVRFKALWDNRAKNPVAWGNALKAVAKEFANDLSVRVDPKLAEAQRARKNAQRSMATQTLDDDDDHPLGKAQGSDFDIGWERLIHGGN